MSEAQQPNGVLYWRGQAGARNFGDFLTELLLDRALLGPRVKASRYRLIGSIIDDSNIAEDLRAITDGGDIAYWGCGARDADRIRPDLLERCDFFGVRGPLSRDLLGLPADTVLGDTGLLAPLLRPAPPKTRRPGQSLCIPHFYEPRTDDQLMAMTGVDVIVRPQIAPSLAAVDQILDAIAGASFVLAGAMHAAVVAHAYETPFAFFDSGHLDIPFKWRDFAASIDIPPMFVATLADGRRAHAEFIAPRARRIPLLGLLETSPYYVRPSILLKAAQYDGRAKAGAALVDLFERSGIEAPAYRRSVGESSRRHDDRIAARLQAQDALLAQAQQVLGALASQGAAATPELGAGRPTDVALFGKRCADLLQRFAEIDRDRASNQARLAEQDVELRELRGAVGSLSERHVAALLALEHDLRSARDEAARLSARNAELQQAHQTIAYLGAQNAEILAKGVADRDQAAAEVEALRLRQEEAGQRLSDQTAVLATAHETLEALSRDYAGVLQQMRFERGATTKELGALEGEIGAVREQLHDVRGQLAQSRAEADQARVSLADARLWGDRLAAEKSSLAEDLSRSREHAAGQAERQSRSEARLEDANAALFEALRSGDRLTAETVRLAGEVEAARRQAESLAESLARTEARERDLRFDLRLGSAPPSALAPWSLALARRAARRRDWTRAERWYALALRGEPRSGRLLVQYGHALKEQGEIGLAASAYARASDQPDAAADTAAHLIHALRASGRDMEAEAITRAGDEGEVAARPVEPDAQARLTPWGRLDLAAARRAARAGDWGAASARYERLLAAAPGRAGLWVQYGHALMQRGALSGARVAYLTALRLEPLRADNHLQLGHALKRSGRAVASRQAYERAFQLAPSDTDARLELEACGVSHADLARLVLTAQTRPAGAARLGLAASFALAGARRSARAGDWTEAARRYRRLAARDPGHWRVWLQLGHALKESGDLSRAEGAYLHALALKPDEAEVCLQLGHALKREGLADEARRFYRRAHDLNPGLADARREIDDPPQGEPEREAEAPAETSEPRRRESETEAAGRLGLTGRQARLWREIRSAVNAAART